MPDYPEGTDGTPVRDTSSPFNVGMTDEEIELEAMAEELDKFRNRKQKEWEQWHR